ncbi:hypothetical protein M5K25_022091 [Dendrobium thyrsiflorum]|uniref:Uncharacterized protein n=1 Tax=Dendrobium thyrsiflorum TaxID=117978 RepID=A0ABD0U5N1_DENTH
MEAETARRRGEARRHILACSAKYIDDMSVALQVPAFVVILSPLLADMLNIKWVSYSGSAPTILAIFLLLLCARTTNTSCKIDMDTPHRLSSFTCKLVHSSMNGWRVRLKGVDRRRVAAGLEAG